MYESKMATANCVSPTSKGFLRNRDKVILLRGKDAIIWSTSISRPLKNIRKRKPESAKKSRIRKLSSLKPPNRYFPAIKPKIISMMTIGIFFSLTSESSIGVLHAIAATTRSG
jgi:hypothetical protein